MLGTRGEHSVDEIMYIYPDFLFEFQCIGSECINTCCEGWNVRVDEYTAEYYDHLDGTFGDFFAPAYGTG